MKLYMKVSLIILAFLPFFFHSQPSYAADVNEATQTLTQVLCNVIGVVQGNVGKTISIIIVISLAIGLFLGKVTWGVAVAMGIGILFGANTMVVFLADAGPGASDSDACESKQPQDPN